MFLNAISQVWKWEILFFRWYEFIKEWIDYINKLRQEKITILILQKNNNAVYNAKYSKHTLFYKEKQINNVNFGKCRCKNIKKKNKMVAINY